MRPLRCNVLLVHPRFGPNSFWNYTATCEAVGAKYSAAPLGLITVAALLPKEWTPRLIDCNAEPLRDEDLAWADLVMTGGMMPQQVDELEVIRRAQAMGKKVVVGGPGVTCSPDIFAQADFRVLGEAEEVMAEFVAAWQSGAERGTFRAMEFPDITKSPIPRFDLLRREHYMHIGVQLGRGCPFNCEFCNVIELNGRLPRVKSPAQMLAELDALAATGYRGHVDFVDDNLIGDRKRIKPFLGELIRWNEAHRHPFEYTMEASVNLADDDELLGLFKKAGFFAVFLGIETPDSDALKHAQKKQNVGRDIAEVCRKIYQAGMFVNGGFIVGFDSERGSVAQRMIECVERTAIPVPMIGLLFALPNTQLERRLVAEKRLMPGTETITADDSDQCTSGLNFETLRPRREIFEDFRAIYRAVFAPEAFYGRVRRLVRQVDTSENRHRPTLGRTLHDLRSFGRVLWWNGFVNTGGRLPFWKALFDCLLHNPLAVKVMVSMAALYLHFRPFSLYLDERLGNQIAKLDAAKVAQVPTAPAVALAKAG